MGQRVAPYGFLAPYLAVFGLFWAGPILVSLWLSFVNTRAFPWALQPAINWTRLPHDTFFWTALHNTLVILLLQVPLMLVLAVALALALNSTELRGRGFYRFAFFAPVVVGAVAYSAVFRLLFNTQFGIVNAAFRSVHLPALDWLYRPGPALAAIVVALTWRWTGYNAILLLAGLAQIPADLYEAARVDGAGSVRQFFSITLPMLRPTLLFCLTLSTIGTLQLFTEPFLITNGGPGNATTTLGVYLYQQGFRSFNFGYASSIAYALVLLSAVFSLLQMRLFGGSLVRRFWLHLLLTPVALLWVAPLWFMAVYATLPDNAIFSGVVRLWPGGELMANLDALQRDTHFLQALGNSFAISSIYTVLGLLLTSMAGYAFARFSFTGRQPLFLLVLGTLTVPYFVVVIPQYILVAAHLDLTNTWWAVILPPLASSLGIFFMRQSFIALPQALLDAARVDGAGELRIFFQVALPLMRPALAALSIILFLASWNDYLWPFLVLSERDMFTAPVALGTLIGLTRISWGGIMSGALTMTLPLVLLFLVLQQHFLAGITAGAVKD